MSENIGSSKSLIAEDEKTVVLMVPEALRDRIDPVSLRATLTSSQAVRVLLCLPDSSGREMVDALAQALTDLDIDVEVLLGNAVEVPNIRAKYILRVPAGTLAADQTEFALALSDVVLVTSASEHSPFVRWVMDLGRTMIVPGFPLPTIHPVVSVTDGLDPDRPGWHALGRYGFGRLEQTMMELLSFGWLGRNQAGVAASLRQLRRSMVGSWRPTPYFAPGGWQSLAPDRAALESSKIIACFNELDRSALHGSYIHRDFIWIEYLGAAFAVWLAVAGHLAHGGSSWGVAELLTLLLVGGLVLGSRRIHLQDRWMACRFGAEQLRNALMSLPLLVLPQALATPDTLPSRDRQDRATKFGFMALAQVKRAVRNQGLPRLDPTFTPDRAATWLRLIIRDQITYHDRNHRKLEQVERGIRFITVIIFLIAIAAVVLHFCIHAEWLLLFTAAGPAFAAALHGTETRLGIVHRIPFSAEEKDQLTRIDGALAELIGNLPSEGEAWREVRRLAYRAATAMGLETTSLHGVMRRYKEELP
ncbi:MAG: hypothetical protein QOI05_922 [Bradyrhizobium sp.]|jgi:hypothetical protein|nr:hypothetical protein [Bradyrhizobium sp.]